MLYSKSFPGSHGIIIIFSFLNLDTYLFLIRMCFHNLSDTRRYNESEQSIAGNLKDVTPELPIKENFIKRS